MTRIFNFHRYYFEGVSSVSSQSLNLHFLTDSIRHPCFLNIVRRALDEVDIQKQGV